MYGGQLAWLIERYGHIPNGNRTYYLSRSQPPVFALMVELFEEDGVRGAKRYLDHLKMEYAFWMDGAESLLLNQPTAAPCACRTVHCSTATGTTVIPRATNRGLRTWKLPATRVVRPMSYRDLRAGAASGWDYSSRWLRDPSRLASIRTTQFIPIDLNAFLFKLESAIANISASKGDKETAEAFRQKANDRRAAVKTAICGTRRAAATAITTGDAKSWRCFLPPVLCRCMLEWRRTSRQNVCLMRSNRGC